MDAPSQTMGGCDICRIDFDQSFDAIGLDLGGKNLAYFRRCAEIYDLVASLIGKSSSHQHLAKGGEKSYLNLLTTRLRSGAHVEESPIGRVFDQVGKKLGLQTDDFLELTRSSDPYSIATVEELVSGFLTRFAEALKASEFRAAYSRWIRPVNINLRMLEDALTTVSKMSSNLSCLRYDCYWDSACSDQSEVDLVESLFSKLAESSSTSRLLAALIRGERLNSDLFRFHVVIFFDTLPSDRSHRHVLGQIRELLHRIDLRSVDPCGYRAWGNGLIDTSSTLSESLRLMLSRDRFLRLRCAPGVDFAFRELVRPDSFFVGGGVND